MSLPYMPLYVSDYEADTVHLTLIEDGAYNRLMRLCWRTPGCSIPNDPRWIMRHLRSDKSTFDNVIKPIIDEFFKTKGNRIHSVRLSVEFAKIKNKIKMAQKNGAKGGRPAKPLKTNKTKGELASIPLNPEKSYPEPEPELELKKKNTKEKKPIDCLMSCLSADHATAVIDHRKKLRKPLTVRAAQLLANEFSKTANPNKSADDMIRNGWQGFKAGWGEKTANSHGGGLARSMAEKARGNENG